MGSDFYHSAILPHAGIIIKICRAYTNNQADFDDYYQEVCLQIWRSRESFNEQCAWTTWIYKITLNVCLTFFKKSKQANITFTSDPIEQAHSCHDTSSQTSQIKQLYKAIHQLSEIDRAIILLYLEQLSQQEIATIIGITPTNAGVKISRIKQRLTSLMQSGGSHE